METVLFWLAVVTLVLMTAIAIEFAWGNRRLCWLGDQPPLKMTNPPRVSVIIAARNEARKLEHALTSMLAQDYPNLEFIVVDDRSTDATGAILDKLVKREPRLQAVHVTELPTGWLGKCHALHEGARRVTGEWLLFTDADVVMEPTTLSRAVAYLQATGLDHLAVAPHLTMSGTLLNMFGGAFTIFFGLYAKPWKASDPKSKRHVGIGAFNLIRTAAYRRVGGHERIALRPDDDMKLGKLIKLAGYRQGLLLGEGFVAVEWYTSVRELVRGLEKNSFAGVEYSLPMVVGASVAQLVCFVWPVIAVAVTSGTIRWLNVAVVAALALCYIDNARFHGLKRWHVIGFPFTALLFQYIIWRATLLTLWKGGIDWRGTHYSLAELKANKV